MYSCSRRLMRGCLVGLSRTHSTQRTDQSTPDPPAACGTMSTVTKCRTNTLLTAVSQRFVQVDSLGQVINFNTSGQQAIQLSAVLLAIHTTKRRSDPGGLHYFQLWRNVVPMGPTKRCLFSASKLYTGEWKFSVWYKNNGCAVHSASKSVEPRNELADSFLTLSKPNERNHFKLLRSRGTALTDLESTECEEDSAPAAERPVSAERCSQRERTHVADHETCSTQTRETNILIWCEDSQKVLVSC